MLHTASFLHSLDPAIRKPTREECIHSFMDHIQHLLRDWSSPGSSIIANKPIRHATPSENSRGKRGGNSRGEGGAYHGSAPTPVKFFKVWSIPNPTQVHTSLETLSITNHRILPISPCMCMFLREHIYILGGMGQLSSYVG